MYYSVTHFLGNRKAVNWRVEVPRLVDSPLWTTGGSQRPDQAGPLPHTVRGDGGHVVGPGSQAADLDGMGVGMDGARSACLPAMRGSIDTSCLGEEPHPASRCCRRSINVTPRREYILRKRRETRPGQKRPIGRSKRGRKLAQRALCAPRPLLNSMGLAEMVGNRANRDRKDHQRSRLASMPEAQATPGSMRSP